MTCFAYTKQPMAGTRTPPIDDARLEHLGMAQGRVAEGMGWEKMRGVGLYGGRRTLVAG
jgi:hypothetical protein